ncbi:response regulator transcription factor [Aeromicrobium terrae]|uniref:Response regulator transcription factor n=1 Tax=Aeromicrobium terrae TaxID=2498846 RepID=A0A5C8NP94_9ACTN|nr:response regulator transcription factor [Aeromicrobium terrae]TXL62937.1 response regulator transcription factor [Aeromicrobium terrae]
MRVVVVDDEKRMVELIVSFLEEAGIEAHGYGNGKDGLAAAREDGVDAVVLDLMLPVLGGIEVCRRLRKEGNQVPILMLTARGSVSERVAGLEAGADDYLVKPFALEELTARLRVFQRRTEAAGEADDRLVLGDLAVDPAARRAWIGDVELDLSRREFDILVPLAENAGHVVSRTSIVDEVWQDDPDIRSNALDVHIYRLRSALNEHSENVTITTLRGVGWRLERI